MQFTDTSSLLIVRSYEVLSLALFIYGAYYVWRSRNPLYYGVYSGTAIGGAVFEWVFDSRYFFRLTVDERFIPAWTMDGVGAPAAMIFFYAFFFGIPTLIILKNHERLTGKFGAKGPVYIFLLLAIFGTPLFECINTSITHIYQYHQEERYLFWGMPWSNFWFSAAMFLFPYFGLLMSKTILVALDRRPKGDPRQYTHYAFVLGFASIITGFFIASTLNGVWYAWAEPWTYSHRPF
ncbi:MAG: hypothetical protein WC997_07490 [Porticoccaceae bacterium]